MRLYKLLLEERDDDVEIEVENAEGVSDNNEDKKSEGIEWLRSIIAGTNIDKIKKEKELKSQAKKLEQKLDMVEKFYEKIKDKIVDLMLGDYNPFIDSMKKKTLKDLIVLYYLTYYRKKFLHDVLENVAEEKEKEGEENENTQQNQAKDNTNMGMNNTGGGLMGF